MLAKRQSTDAPDRMPTAAAAEYLGMSPTTLETWRSTGRYPLKFIKLGRRVLYNRADLDEFMAARTATSTAQLAAASA
jgi:excisionase family DNA binding protein